VQRIFARSPASSQGDSIPDSDQLTLIGSPARKVKPIKVAEPIAAIDPVAVVRIDTPVPHLDRDFDYSVPARWSDLAVVGARVRVRFAGRLMDACIVRREPASDLAVLKPIDRVVGTVPMCTPETLQLISATAHRYAGTLWDVMRTAVPPRHARAEAVLPQMSDWRSSSTATESSWSGISHSAGLMERIDGAEPVRAAWNSVPGTSWATQVAELINRVTATESGSVLVLVPDVSDVDRVCRAIPEACDAGAVAVIGAHVGPQARYAAFLRAMFGAARIVVGTRTAAFTPIPDLRLIIMWDDGDDVYADPHAPYWDAREVAALRSHLANCHFLIGGPARTVVVQQWCESGWATSLTLEKSVHAAVAPRVQAVEPDDFKKDEAAAYARIPSAAWQVAQTGLKTGPVLVQVARRGYVPLLACQKCRTPAECSCGGAFALVAGSSIPMCSRCGSLASNWRCNHCGGSELRAMSVGVERTAEELGRAFPGVRIIWSQAEHMVREVSAEPALVVATPGAEPVAAAGYEAVILLDANWGRTGLGAGEAQVRRWFHAAALARPQARVMVTAPINTATVQALVRWDSVWFAARELGERRTTGLPPASRVAALEGDATSVREVEQSIEVSHRTLGPVEMGEEKVRLLVLVDRAHGTVLSEELIRISVRRSAEKTAAKVHVQLDPREL
jgi:primosomal protein N' (replication factor Y) (superfamily II helicase)